eukprot:2310119-Prymnesium_polylepis.1
MTAPSPTRSARPSAQLVPQQVEKVCRKRWATEQVSKELIEASGNPTTCGFGEPLPKKARSGVEERLQSKAAEICGALPAHYTGATSAEERMIHASA